MTESDRAAAWSRYWASGSSAAAADAFAEQHEGPIHRFWSEAFATMQPDQRVLDLATGNGPLVQMLLDRCQAGTLDMPQVEAVDLAELNPAWLAKYPGELARRVTMRAGVRMESLPFAAASFDWVLSQYGFEYADMEPAAGELLRVLRGEGRAHLLLHHSGSRLVDVACEEVRHLQWLCASEGLLAVARGMANPLARAATPTGRAALANDAVANRLRQDFNAVLRELEQRCAASQLPDPLLEIRDAVAQALSLAGPQGEAAALAAIDSLAQALQDSVLRLSELQSHALDEQRLDALLALLGEGGRRPVAAQPVHHAQGALMGWALRLHPRS